MRRVFVGPCTFTSQKTWLIWSASIQKKIMLNKSGLCPYIWLKMLNKAILKRVPLLKVGVSLEGLLLRKNALLFMGPLCTSGLRISIWSVIINLMLWDGSILWIRFWKFIRKKGLISWSRIRKLLKFNYFYNYGFLIAFKALFREKFGILRFLLEIEWKWKNRIFRYIIKIIIIVVIVISWLL